jgi:Outer membrane receptor for monomeric catechols
MLYGRGQAGGVINQVSKMPLLTDKYKLTGSLGTDDYREVTADLNKKISEHAAMRVNLMKRDEGSWRSNPADGAQPELHRSGVAASLGLGLNTDNELTFNHMYLRTRDNPDYGVSFSPITKRPTTTFPSSYFWGTNGTFDDSDTNISTVAYTHKFSPDTQLRTQIRYADYQRAYWAITPSPTLAPTAAGKTGPNA